jgi:hypothetical protein
MLHLFSVDELIAPLQGARKRFNSAARRLAAHDLHDGTGDEPTGR